MSQIFNKVKEISLFEVAGYIGICDKWWFWPFLCHKTQFNEPFEHIFSSNKWFWGVFRVQNVSQI
jgi:hypothetical protein